jgi:hypothetical protein
MSIIIAITLLTEAELVEASKKPKPIEAASYM